MGCAPPRLQGVGRFDAGSSRESELRLPLFDELAVVPGRRGQDGGESEDVVL